MLNSIFMVWGLHERNSLDPTYVYSQSENSNGQKFGSEEIVSCNLGYFNITWSQYCHML